MDTDTISVLCMDGDEYLMELSKTRYKLSVAEECFIGFSSRDHSTQTDKNEILDMKELVDIIDTLAVDTNEMKKDVNFMRSLMKADFESKLKAKSIEIYVRMNERLSVIDKVHKETIKTIRSACKQQLVDAVAQIHRYYNGDIERKLSNHMQKTTTTDRRIKELEALTKTNESTIQTLLLRLAKYKDEEENTIEQVEIQSYKSESPDLVGQLEEERDNLKEEMAKQSEQLVKAEEELAQKENICRELKKEFESVNRKYEECKKIIHELKAEKIELLSNMEQNRVANQKVLEIQKLALQKERDEALMKSKQATEHVTEIRRAPEDVDQIAKLLQENKKLSLQLNKEIENKEMQKLFQKDFEKFKTKEEKLMKEIGRLQNELKQVGIAWEKKFKILQQSMYALKDESYLRQTLLRQSAMLHQATVSYAYESPVNTKAGSLFNKALDIKTSPLPAIGQHRPATSADFISYTVTPPNDRRTFVFSANENQIMSDDEDLPTDVQPFPQPPTNGMIT